MTMGTTIQMSCGSTPTINMGVINLNDIGWGTIGGCGGTTCN